MNGSHVIGTVAGGGATGMLATVLAYFQGVPADVAASEAGLIVLVLGTVAGLVNAILTRKPAVLPITQPTSSPQTTEEPRS